MVEARNQKIYFAVYACIHTIQMALNSERFINMKIGTESSFSGGLNLEI